MDRPSNLFSALEKIEGIAFTPREVDIIAFIVSGRSAKKIAQFFEIKPKTVESHIRSIASKFGCNSQEKIRDFIETSGKFSLVKKHYTNLLMNSYFEKELKNIFEANQKKSIKCLIINDQNKEKLALVQGLEKHLPFAGVQVCSEKLQYERIQLQKIQNANFLIYPIFHEDLQDRELNSILELLKTIKNRNISSKNTPKLILLIDRSETKNSISEVSENSDIIFIYQSDYHLLVLETLKNILSETNINRNILAFKNSCYKISDSSNNKIDLNHQSDKFSIKRLKFYFQNILNTSFRYSKKQKKLSKFFLISLLAIFVLYLGISRPWITRTEYIISSDLNIPLDNVLLNRPELLNKINDKLKKQDDLKKVIILGAGGAGKTTLARQFSKLQKASVIYEINAETPNVLSSSFRNLSYSLAKTKDQREELEFIQKIQSYEEKEKQIIAYVKDRLKEKSNWLLIFDNVEDISKIREYLPQDPRNWGKGSIILTTRNSNVKNGHYTQPENIVNVGELDTIEAYQLFCKILYGHEGNKFSKVQKEEILVFLENIDHFPLDISLASFYIKNTKISLNQYIERMFQFNALFETSQKLVLSEIGDYSNTRYSILALSLDKLINSHPEFKELIFALLLFDSQKIPVNFLEFYKSSPVADQFFESLTKFSILNKPIQHDNALGILSIHRSTQTFGKSYLNVILNKETKIDFLRALIASVKKYYEMNSKKNPKIFIEFLPHLESLLHNIQGMSFSKEVETELSRDLHYIIGYINYSVLKNFVSANQHFLKIINSQDSNHQLSTLDHAMMLKDMGNIAIKLCNLENNYNHRSIEFCKKVPHAEMLVAENFQIIGSNARKRDNFEEAKRYLFQALKQLSTIDKPKKQELEALIYNQLGWLYSVNFIHKHGAEQGKQFLEKSLEILGSPNLWRKEKLVPSTKLPCSVAQNRCKLGLVNIRLGNFQEALENCFLEAEYIKDQDLDGCPNDILVKAQIAEGLGEIYLRTGNLEKAEEKFSYSIKIFDAIVGKTPSLAPKTLRVETRIKLGRLDEAYQECLENLKLAGRERNNFHNLIYLLNHFHAGVIQYRKGNVQVAVQHFSDFLTQIKPFSVNFLDQASMVQLEKEGCFATINPGQSTNEIELINVCISRSQKVLSAIYNKPDHPFLEEYVQKVGLAK